MNHVHTEIEFKKPKTMTRKLTIYTIALIISSISLAQQNHSEITQEGSDNSVFLTQLGLDNEGIAELDGNQNTTTIHQFGTSNWARHTVIRGNNNKAKIIQNGSDNRAGVRNWDGFDNKAYITQTGDNLLANGQQNGKNGTIDIVQIGSENTISFFQNLAGVGNHLKIRQDGTNLNSNVDQNGLNNYAEINQGGINHNGQIFQEGENDMAIIYQQGNNNQATISQNSLGSVAKSFQVGEGHLSTIDQGGQFGNFAKVFQVGNSHTANINQTGSYNVSIVVQSN